jgi:hypothetical protein
MAEPLMDLLASLPEATPEPERAQRFRNGCHARLARQVRRRRTARTSTAPSTAAYAWRPLVALLGLAYVIDVIVIAMRVFAAAR